MPDRDPVEVEAEALMEAAVEKRLARLRNEIAGVETPAMRGDCLAVMLVSDFEAWADEDEETDESGTWKQSAVDACNGVLDAIVARCRAAIVALPLSDAPASPWPKVKALEWTKHPERDAWRVDTVLGTYNVFALVSPASWTFDGGINSKPIDQFAASPEAAKAAAQADYERRILSALDGIPTPPTKDD